MQKLRRNKSDTADAQLIARFLKSEQDELRPWSPRSTTQQQVTELSRYADSLTQDTGRLKTKLEAQPDKAVLAFLNRRINYQQKERKEIRAKITNLIAKDSTLSNKSSLLKSIPGIGDVAAQIILAELPEISQSRRCNGSKTSSTTARENVSTGRLLPISFIFSPSLRLLR